MTEPMTDSHEQRIQDIVAEESRKAGVDPSLVRDGSFRKSYLTDIRRRIIERIDEEMPELSGERLADYLGLSESTVRHHRAVLARVTERG